MRHIFALLLLLLALAPATWSSPGSSSTSVWMDPRPGITAVDGTLLAEQSAVSVDLAHLATQSSVERVGGVSSLFAADLVSPAPAVRSYAGSAGEAPGIPCTGLEPGFLTHERRLRDLFAFRQRPGVGHVRAVDVHRRSPYRSTGFASIHSFATGA